MIKKIFEDLKILVVDDDEFMLDMISATLNGIGIQDIKVADNGNDALNLIGEGETAIDVIMCDLYMPDMDGIEFLNLATNNGFDGSLVLFSGVNQEILEQAGTLASAKAVNFLGCMEKPINQHELMSILEKVGTSKAVS